MHSPPIHWLRTICLALTLVAASTSEENPSRRFSIDGILLGQTAVEVKRKGYLPLGPDRIFPVKMFKGPTFNLAGLSSTRIVLVIGSQLEQNGRVVLRAGDDLTTVFRKLGEPDRKQVGDWFYEACYDRFRIRMLLSTSKAPLLGGKYRLQKGGIQLVDPSVIRFKGWVAPSASRQLDR